MLLWFESASFWCTCLFTRLGHRAVLIKLSKIPDILYFIFHHKRIWREAKDIGFEKVSQGGKFTTGSAILAKPADWNKTISLIYGSTESAFANTVTLYLRTY